jgi:RNA polymerase sigma-70 factor (ECF subfamily)
MTAHEFNKMIPIYRPELMRYAVFLTGSHEDAQDLVQTTYLKAIKNWTSYEDLTNLRAWLFTILKNSFINHYRANKQHGSIINFIEDYTQINAVNVKDSVSPESAYLHTELKEVIAQIPSKFRTPFNMLVDGYKYEEIAKELGVIMGTVKSRIFFARKQIMDILKNDHKFKNNLKPLTMTTETSGASARETINAQINDVAKESIKRRIIKAIAEEKLYTNEAGALIGINPTYLSMMKNHDLWEKCPILAWIAAQKWVNSGLSIVKYAEKTGTKSVKKEQSTEKLQPPTGTPEAMANAHEIAQGKEPTIHDTRQKKEVPVLLIVFGNGKESIELTDISLEDVINEIKSPSGIYYYGDNGNIVVYQTKKVYSIEVKMVETRF